VRNLFTKEFLLQELGVICVGAVGGQHIPKVQSSSSRGGMVKQTQRGEEQRRGERVTQ